MRAQKKRAILAIFSRTDLHISHIHQIFRKRKRKITLNNNIQQDSRTFQEAQLLFGQAKSVLGKKLEMQILFSHQPMSLLKAT